MGYYVEVSCENLVIPRRSVSACLEAINAMWGDDGQPVFSAGGSCARLVDGHLTSDRQYAWVARPPQGGYPSLVDALKAWRYHALVATSVCNNYIYPKEVGVGDVVILTFTGEKWGDDEVLYEVLASFLRDGGEIRCVGEEHEQWRYLFNSGEIQVQEAQISWGAAKGDSLKLEVKL